ncbi:MAG: SH3 domain-containing protein [Endomicrobium sp.]|nr:SH3 domain-containing protein [Endomicrobium sp.]
MTIKVKANMKKFLGFITVCLCFSICFAENIHQTQIDNAEENFKRDNFSKTIEIYESLIKIEKVNNPYIFYNLSNAYYRNGNIGKAILNIEKALRLAPRDREIRNNADYLNAVAEHVRQKNFSDIFLQYFSLNEITVVSVAFVILLFAVLSLFIIKRKPILKKTMIVLVVFLIICIPLFALKVYNEIVLKEAVVLYTSDVRSGPSENDTDIFTIPAGKVVSVIVKSGDWNNIKVRYGNESLTGWIENKAIGNING